MKAFILRCWHAGRSALFVVALLPVVAAAEVVLDGSVGPAGSLAGPDFQIGENLGTRAGDNLFHSFDSFNIANGESATFSGSAGIDNVVGRVTGGDPSQINGALNCSIDGANLYLINSAGVMFGNAASVNVSGSFHASTADYLDFSDGVSGERFEAFAGGAIPRLQSVAPAAFGFLDRDNAAIGFSGNVALNGAGFEFTAGSLQFDAAQISAPGARLALNAVGDGSGNGAITLNDSSIDVSADAAGSLSLRGGDLQLQNSALLATTGDRAADAVGIDIDMRDAVSLDHGSRIIAGTRGAGQGAAIRLRVNSLSLRGEVEIGSDVEAGASGSAGDIDIEVVRAELLGSGSATPEISSDTEGLGDGGDIRLVVSESLAIHSDGELPADKADLAGISTESKVDESAAASGGTAGDIRIETGALLLENGRIASGTATAGAGGRIELAASEIELRAASAISSDTNSTQAAAGDGGAIAISADRLILRDESEISSDVADGATGDGGSIRIDVRQLALLGANGDTPEISSDTAGSGAGGQVNISARESLTIRSGELAAETDAGGDSEQRAGIFSNSKPPQSGVSGGASGRISINAGRVELDGGVIASNSQTTGAAGNVVVAVDTDLRLANGSEISVRSDAASDGVGDAGTVSVSAQRVELTGGSAITAHAARSDGGSVSLTASEYLLVRDSVLTADVAATTGGDISLDAPIVIADGAALTATATTGQGGRIIVDGQYFFDDGARLDASAGDPLGIDGTVEVNAPEVDLSGSLEALDATFLDASSMLRALCSARRSGERLGSFTVVKHRGLPTSAEGLPLFERKSTSPPAQQLSLDARRAMLQRDWSLAAEKLAEAEREVDRSDSYALIHIGRSLRLLATHPDWRESGLRRAHTLLQAAGDLALSRNDSRAESYALGNLAELYRAERRYREALFLASAALAAAERAQAPESSYRWHWLSGRLLWAEGRAGEALQAYRRAVAILAETRQEALVSQRDGAFFRRSVAPVYGDLVEALLDSAARVEATSSPALLRESRRVMEQLKAAELRDYFGDPCITELQASARGLDQLAAADSSVAVLYPVMLRGRTELLVSTAAGLARYSVPVGKRELEQAAKRLRVALQQPGSDDYFALGQQLYDWLLRPWLAAALADGVDTLVYVPDGALRSVPLAALHDGEQFLIERVALSLAPGLELIDPQPLTADDGQLLLAGLSESVQGYPALPKVAEEVAAVSDLFAGEVLLNAEYSSAALTARLAETQPAVLHIASHAEFGGSPERNYLLTHDGRLSMGELASLIGVARFREQPLELLVLSACETAVGDDRAALGLAGVALQAGARSVMGSLWSVSDEATYELVVEFYRQLRAGNGRADALRAAQRQVLAREEFVHPVYWAPFLLISNWL